MRYNYIYVKSIRPILPHVLGIVFNIMLRLGYRGFNYFKNSSINNPPLLVNSINQNEKKITDKRNIS